MKYIDFNEQVAANFKRHEFACKCGCGFADPHPDLVAGLQQLREALGQPVMITSGCRCKRHNLSIGGSRNSQHVFGKAADIWVDGLTARQIYEAAAKIPAFRGFGVDDARAFVHVDVRDRPGRWCYREDGRETMWRDTPRAESA